MDGGAGAPSARPLVVLVVSEIAGMRASLEGAGVAEAADVRWASPWTATAAELAEADVIVADPPSFAHACLPRMAGVPEGARRLRWVQSTFAGVDAIVRFEEAEGTPRPYALTRLGGVFGAQMAEYVLLHVLAQERGMRGWVEGQRARRWKAHAAGAPLASRDGADGRVRDPPPRRLSALALGVLGYGDIGAEVARQCKALGMRVVALRRGGSSSHGGGGDDDEGAEGKEEEAGGVGVAVVRGRGAVSGILATCDYVVNLLPSTRETRGLLSASVWAEAAAARTSRVGPCLINVGRGDVASEGDLVAAMDAGHLRTCVLDVFPVEPLPETSPLWSHPCVTVTPHVAAQTSPDDLAALFAENLARYQATGAQHLLYPVRGDY